MRFWDSSAVVPLLVREPATEALRALLRDDPGMVVWPLTSLEVTSAIWRRARTGDLEPTARDTALQGLQELESAWNMLTALGETVARARRLLAVHPLRTADAAQLGAALVLCRERTGLVEFVTLDERLAEAARREGFRVLPPVTS